MLEQENIWGCEGILLGFSQTCQKYSSKKAHHVNSGAIIFKSKHVGCHFCSDIQGVLEGSQRFCNDFKGFYLFLWDFFPDFHQIKTFWCAIAHTAPSPPTPVILPLRLGGAFSGYLVVKSHYGFTTMREMKYTHYFDITMGNKIALHHECCFPKCTKSW